MRGYQGAIGVVAAGWLMAQPATADDLGRRNIDIVSVTASSVDGRERYAPENAIDGRTDTAWVVANRGPGEWLEVRFGDRTRVAQVGVVAGYDKVRDDEYGDRWDKNNRVRTLAVEWDGGERQVLLDDVRGMQWFDIDADVDRVRLRVVTVRPGARWNDTAVAEVAFRRPLPTPVEKKAASPRPAADPLVPISPPPATAPRAPDLGRSDESEASSRPSLRNVTVWVASLGVLGLVVVGGLRRRLARGSSPQDDALVARAREALQAIQRDARNLGERYAPVLAACVDLVRSAEHTGEHCAATRVALARTRGLSSAGAVARRARLEEREARARSRLVRIVDQLEDVAAHVATIPRDRLDQHDVDSMIRRLNEEVRFIDTAEEELQCNES
jgi:hypothetical protein